MGQEHAGYACPYEPFDPETASIVAVEYAQAFAAQLVATHGDELGRRGPALAVFLRSRLDPDDARVGFDTVWNPDFGAARRVLLTSDSAWALGALAALGLRLTTGEPAQWSLSLGRATRLVWNRWLLPEADAIAVTARGDAVIIETSLRGERAALQFTRRGGEWQCAGWAAMPAVPMVRCAFAVVPPGTEYLDRAGEFSYTQRSAIDTVAALEHGVAVLEKYAPPYLEWIDRVVRYVVPVHAEPGVIRSGSDFDQPGTIKTSVASALAQGEMLVHEASHQYFHLLWRLGDVHDPSDTETFYSPVKQTARPIDKILLAYHAFANVLLFYRSCLAADLDDGRYCRHHEALLLPQLRSLESALRRSSAVTSLGRALWEPLAARIAS